MVKPILYSIGVPGNNPVKVNRQFGTMIYLEKMEHLFAEGIRFFKDEDR